MIQSTKGKLFVKCGQVIEESNQGFETVWSIQEFITKYDSGHMMRKLLQRLYGPEQLRIFVKNLREDLT